VTRSGAAALLLIAGALSGCTQQAALPNRPESLKFAAIVFATSPVLTEAKVGALATIGALFVAGIAAGLLGTGHREASKAL
jgi:hypothetical protein